MAITYTNKGSATTTAIANAPTEVQRFWKLCDNENVSIARVRKFKDRYEHTSPALWLRHLRSEVQECPLPVFQAFVALWPWKFPRIKVAEQ